MANDALEPSHLIGHVKDSTYFEVPRDVADGLGIPRASNQPGRIELPQPLALEKPLVEANPKLHHGALDFRLTKFMVLELVAAILVALIFILVARKIASGGRPRGKLWNMFEALLVFIRDEVARPAIGRHDADKFLPFLWTMFFFVLGCNLLGMVPWAGSATGALGTTLALAIISFGAVVGGGISKMGFVGFWKGQVPHMDLPPALGLVLKPAIFVLEVVGLFIRHFVLAVRLLANMFAGHLVLAVIVAFISATYATSFFHVVWPASVFGAVALSLLELFVAFLQAYIFTFLTALFIGMAVHPH